MHKRIHFNTYYREPGRTKDMRLSILFVLYIFFSVAVIVKLFLIQVLDGDIYSAQASEQYLAYQEFTPRRGDIFAIENNSQSIVPIAENKIFGNVYAVPNEVKSPYYVAAELAVILDLDEGMLLERLLKEGDPYEPIKNKANDEELQNISERNFSGIYIAEETYRHYPLYSDMSQLTGFVGNEGESLVGQYGIEGYHEDVLGGNTGYIKYAKDAIDNILHIFRKSEEKPLNGDSIVLTIDRVIQFRACASLNSYIEKTGSVGGSVLVLEVETGKVRAMCSFPTYDANNFYETENTQAFNNPAIFKSYEPGSVFKPLTMAAAINEKKVDPTTTYVDEGELKYGKFVIKNSDLKAHGEVDMITVLSESLNTGAVFVAEELGKEKFADYVRLFGFGEHTGIELTGERTGDISSLDKRGEIYTATASYGHGITVTPMQLASAYGVLANNGVYVAPTIIEKIIDQAGEETVIENTDTRKVLDSRSATLVSSMMVSVVENVHGALARVDGYRIAGKTGTALIADTKSAGYIGDTNHTFVGFGPVEDPQYVILTKLEKPTSYEFSSGTAAPLFGEIAKFVLQYYNIPPTVE